MRLGETQVIHPANSALAGALQTPTGDCAEQRVNGSRVTAINRERLRRLLERLVLDNIDPTKSAEFKLTFTPSAFKPPKPDRPRETPEMSRQESAITAVISSLFSCALIALTVSLVKQGHTHWALLPGILGGMLALGAIVYTVQFVSGKS
jgi:hypothetical protein